MRVTFAVGRMVGRNSEIVVAAPKDGRGASPASSKRLASRPQPPLPSPDTVH